MPEIRRYKASWRRLGHRFPPIHPSAEEERPSYDVAELYPLDSSANCMDCRRAAAVVAVAPAAGGFGRFLCTRCVEIGPYKLRINVRSPCYDHASTVERPMGVHLDVEPSSRRAWACCGGNHCRALKDESYATTPGMEFRIPVQLLMASIHPREVGV